MCFYLRQFCFSRYLPLIVHIVVNFLLYMFLLAILILSYTLPEGQLRTFSCYGRVDGGVNEWPNKKILNVSYMYVLCAFLYSPCVQCDTISDLSCLRSCPFMECCTRGAGSSRRSQILQKSFRVFSAGPVLWRRVHYSDWLVDRYIHQTHQRTCSGFAHLFFRF